MAILAKGGNQLVDQAAESIDALAQRAKDALYKASGSETAQRARAGLEEARSSAWRIAGQARDQAGDLADQVYSRGQKAVALVQRQAGEQPLIAILVAGLFGFLLGYIWRAAR